jgi:hypothetical protein
MLFRHPLVKRLLLTAVAAAIASEGLAGSPGRRERTGPASPLQFCNGGHETRTAWLIEKKGDGTLNWSDPGMLMPPGHCRIYETPTWGNDYYLVATPDFAPRPWSPFDTQLCVTYQGQNKIKVTTECPMSQLQAVHRLTLGVGVITFSPTAAEAAKHAPPSVARPAIETPESPSPPVVRPEGGPSASSTPPSRPPPPARREPPNIKPFPPDPGPTCTGEWSRCGNRCYRPGERCYDGGIVCGALDTFCPSTRRCVRPGNSC